MTREEAIKILSDYEENGCGFCHQGGDEVPQAFEMAVKALEAWEKVIERLTEMANDKWNEQVGSSKGLNDAIEVIEDILSEVEDET